MSSSLELGKKEIRLLTFAALAILATTLLIREIAPGKKSAPDYELGKPGPEVTISIATGDSGITIARKLRDSEVVKSSEAFFRLAVADERSSRISPGDHRVETRIPARVALEQLLDPKRINNLIVVRDGAWRSEVELELIKAGFAKTDVDIAMKKVKLPNGFAAKQIEGFLYPAFYSFAPGTRAEEAVSSMIDRFSYSTKDVDWSSKSPWSPYQVLIIASLIESEGTPDVHGKVARVIYNRLEKRMPLQLDSTVHYVLQRRGEIRVSLKETAVKSVYNTFARYGLPPTPIGSPTRASIDAALQPEPGNWLYFVTVKPGETKFADSYDDFLALKAEYKRNFKAGFFS